MRDRRDAERGAASVELVLLTPLLVIFLLFAVAGGRLVMVRMDLDAAARDGARAASMARSPGQAQADAESVIRSTMEGRHLSCHDSSYRIDAQSLQPGSFVSASVECNVSFADLTLLPLPVSRSMTANFTEVVDQYRQEAG